MPWILYNILFVIGFTLMLPRFLFRMARRGGYRKDFEQRFGRYQPDVEDRLAAGERIWVHAVSVGELFVALRLMREWRERRPGLRFVLTTTTSTGHTLARKELPPEDVLLYFPLDLPFIMRRVLDLIRPKAIVLVELELWPNLIRLAHERAIPVMLVNGRVSDHSFGGYQKLRYFTRRVLPMMDLFCVQTRLDGERLAALGAPANRVRLLGSAKYDVAEASDGGAAAAEELLRAALITEHHQILLGGSTWPGEEDALLDVYKGMKTRHRNLVLVLAPRHVERAADVVRQIKEHAMTFVRRSELAKAAPRAMPQVFLLDTTGELKNFYACADVIFVGKSLTQHGGQNPIEPAMYGKAIVCGPHMENFRGVVEDFRRADAMVQVPDLQNLRRAVDELLASQSRRIAMGQRAERLVQEKKGAVARTLELLDLVLEADAPPEDVAGADADE